jgi:hypothetical protein
MEVKSEIFPVFFEHLPDLGRGKLRHTEYLSIQRNTFNMFYKIKEDIYLNTRSNI